MDQSTIIPFIKATQNVFETMLQLPLKIGSPKFKTGPAPSYDVSGIIGMSGDVEGSVVLSFPTQTAERIVEKFVGEKLDKTHPDFADAIGELVNMISGGAKAQLNGKQVSISCPSVVIGSDHVVFGRKDVVCISVPCDSQCGSFSVEVSMKQTASEVVEAAAKAST